MSDAIEELKADEFKPGDDIWAAIILLRRAMLQVSMRLVAIDGKLDIIIGSDQRELWKFNRAHNVTPNIDEPAKGQIETLSDMLTTVVDANNQSYQTVMKTLETITARVSGMSAELAWAHRLEKFFEPAMVDGTPLDGKQIATKAFVDDGLNRLAAALRREVADAVEFAKALASNGLAAAWGFARDPQTGITVGTIRRIAHRLADMSLREAEREHEEEIRKHMPTKRQLVLAILTGNMGHLRSRNGVK